MDVDRTVAAGTNTIRQAGAAAGVASGSALDRTQARKLVLVSIGAVLVMNVYRARREDGSLYKRLWGTGVLGVMLSLAADFAPSIAGPFALLVALGMFTNGGDQAFQNLLGKVEAAPLTGAQAKQAAPTATKAATTVAGAAANVNSFVTGTGF